MDEQPKTSDYSEAKKEYLGRLVGEIDLSQATPYNDPGCAHEMEEESEEDIPGTVTLKCRKCPYGVMIRKP